MFIAWSIKSGNFKPLYEALVLSNISYHLELVKKDWWVLILHSNIRYETYKHIEFAINHLDPIVIKGDTEFIKFKLEC